MRTGSSYRTPVQVGIVVGLMACGAALTYVVRSALATGIPTTNPLTYTGSLLTYGVPDNSSHQMSAALYINGAVQCSSTTGSVTCVNGQFTIPLPPACEPIIQNNASVDIEVFIDGTGMGMVPLAAVPYAVVAGNVSASGVTGVLPVTNGGTGSSTQNFVTQDVTTGEASLPSGATTQRTGAPVNGMIRYNSTTGMFEGYANGTWQTFVTGNGGPQVATYTSSGTFTAPAGVTSVQVLVVAGGGGGTPGNACCLGGGGGGAGGLIYNSSYAVTAGQGISVVVGAGGGLGQSGGNSAFGSLTAVGGGQGANYSGLSAGSGGSTGGLVAPPYTQSTLPTPVSGQGNAGGTGSTMGGGGGGAGGAGVNGGGSAPFGGQGGAGLPYSISGATVYYAGGGGGSVRTNYNPYVAGATGGIGGGGNGCDTSGANCGNGTPNSGGGGGGGIGMNGSSAGLGGSGVVIVSYQL